jgi:hypothetical protein
VAQLRELLVPVRPPRLRAHAQSSHHVAVRLQRKYYAIRLIRELFICNCCKRRFLHSRSHAN